MCVVRSRVTVLGSFSQTARSPRGPPARSGLRGERWGTRTNLPNVPFPCDPDRLCRGHPNTCHLDTARTTCPLLWTPHTRHLGRQPTRHEKRHLPPCWGRPNLVPSWHRIRDTLALSHLGPQTGHLARAILAHKLDILSEPSWPTNWTSCPEPS